MLLFSHGHGFVCKTRLEWIDRTWKTHDFRMNIYYILCVFFMSCILFIRYDMVVVAFNVLPHTRYLLEWMIKKQLTSICVFHWGIGSQTFSLQSRDAKEPIGLYRLYPCPKCNKSIYIYADCSHVSSQVSRIHIRKQWHVFPYQEKHEFIARLPYIFLQGGPLPVVSRVITYI